MVGIYIVTGCGLFFMITFSVMILLSSKQIPFTRLGHNNYLIKLDNMYYEFNIIEHKVINLKSKLKEINQYIEKLKKVVVLVMEGTDISRTKSDDNLLIIKHDLERYSDEFYKDIQQEIIYIDNKINDSMNLNDCLRKYKNKSYMPLKVIKLIKNQEEYFVSIKNSIEILSYIYNNYMRLLNDIENNLKQYE